MSFCISSTVKVGLAKFQAQVMIPENNTLVSYYLEQEQTLYPVQSPSMATASAASFTCARQWLRTCLREHGSCSSRSMTINAALPSRLIDVGVLGGDVPCRLHETSKSETAQYLTLSHRWGGANVFRATKATYDEMLTKIEILDLPKTFQDAIYITQKLGYRYIWVDSLCIIQDDPADWEAVSRQMADIYSNSALTIAALWGQDSHAGCFIERRPLATQACHIGDWRGDGLFVRSTDQTRASTLESLNPKPLLERAWVLQERLLSPRILYYGPWELHWECQEIEGNETRPEGNVNWGFEHLKSRFGNLCRQTEAAGQDHDITPSATENFEATGGTWDMIRRSYWASKLTYHSDSLVAMSGITSALRTGTWMRFAYGMWMDSISIDLLWKVTNPHETLRALMFPTWTWASVERGQFAAYSHAPSYQATRDKCTYHCKIQPTRCVAMGADPTALGSRELRIRGPLIHTILELDKDGRPRALNPRLPKWGYHMDFHSPDVREVICLVVIDFRHEDEDDPMNAGGGCAGLILITAPNDGQRMPVYNRVGQFSDNRYGFASQELTIGLSDFQEFWLA